MSSTFNMTVNGCLVCPFTDPIGLPRFFMIQI
jgi:hypothetical protein